MSQTASAERGKDKGGKPERPGLGARIALFFRQVIAELRKVNKPTRKELTTYTIVVLVFSAIFAAYVLVLDLGFGQIAFAIFG